MKLKCDLSACYSASHFLSTMLQTVISSFLLVLLGCSPLLSWALEAVIQEESICQQLTHFDRLQAATAANGTLHVLIRNPSSNTSSYLQLPLNEATVDNVKGRLKVFPKQEVQVQTVQTASDVPWLQWLSWWEKDDNNNKNKSLFDHLQLAMLNISKPYVGSLAILDGRHYCSSSSSTTSLQEGKLIDCGLYSDERVVGSLASVDYSQETESKPMLILVEVLSYRGKKVLVQLRKNNNLALSKLSGDKRNPDPPPPPMLGHSNLDHFFGFIIAGTVHLWMSNSTNGQPWICLFADSREDMPEVQPLRPNCSLKVAASEYFQCTPASSSSYSSSSSSLPSPILSGQKSVIFAATLGSLLVAVFFGGVFLLTKRRSNRSKSKRKGGNKADNISRSKSKSSASGQLELTGNNETMSGVFQGGNNKSESLRQAGAIGSATVPPSSGSESLKCLLSSHKKQTRSAHWGKQWKLKDHPRLKQK